MYESSVENDTGRKSWQTGSEGNSLSARAEQSDHVLSRRIGRLPPLPYSPSSKTDRTSSLVAAKVSLEHERYYSPLTHYCNVKSAIKLNLSNGIHDLPKSAKQNSYIGQSRSRSLLSYKSAPDIMAITSNTTSGHSKGTDTFKTASKAEIHIRIEEPTTLGSSNHTGANVSLSTNTHLSNTA